MPAKKRPAPRRKPVKRTPARRKPTAGKRLTIRPRGRSLPEKAAVWVAHFIARQASARQATVRTRKDAAILRVTHAGCPKCHGTGTIATHDKDGQFTGSKSCNAKPSQVRVSRAAVARQARFGVDKRSGLIGWRCPCGGGEKPRYRDAKTASAAIKTHDRKRHAGATIGAAWYLQLPEAARPATAPKPPATAKAPATI